MSRGSRVLVWSAAGMIATAALVHLFDPVSGRHRRQMYRNQGMDVARRIGNGVIVAQLTRYGVRRANDFASRLRRAAAHF